MNELHTQTRIDLLSVFAQNAVRFLRLFCVLRLLDPRVFWEIVLSDLVAIHESISCFDLDLLSVLQGALLACPSEQEVPHSLEIHAGRAFSPRELSVWIHALEICDHSLPRMPDALE